MATYNGVRYLSAQLASLASQTLLPDELVVCDDASSDSTCTVIERFQEVAPFPVHLVRSSRNLGPTKRFERGIELAIGDVVFLSDQDDVWFAEKLQTMMTFLAQRPGVLVVTCDQELTDQDLHPTGLTTFGQHRSRNGQRRSPFAVGCCTAFREQLREVLLPFPAETPAHDVWLDSLSEAMNVRECLPRVLQYHRRHTHNVTPRYLNPTSPATRLERMRSALASGAHADADYRLEVLDTVAARLEAIDGHTSPDLAHVDVAASLRSVRRERLALTRRQALLEMSRPCRLPRSVGMLLRGDYGYFSGLRSLVKDLLSSPPG